MFFFPNDIYYLILVVPAILFSLWAQFKVNSTFKKYQNQGTRHNLTGAEAAQAVLCANQITDVTIERVPGNLTDHFDPRERVIRLSESVHDSTSVSAVGVAAHEAGHAAQYAQGYGPVKLRSAIIPVSRIGSSLSFPLILIGLVFSSEALFIAGILFFVAALVFQLVTLPVEYNASTRALQALSEGILYEDELKGAEKTLNAAALTYVAALAVSVAQLLRLLLLFGGNNRRRK